MKRLCVLAILCLAAACKKEKNDHKEPESATDLLTKKEWIMSGHGFDDNNNDTLDSWENIIQDCQKDNSYVFKKDGTGAYADNALVCGTNDNNDFDWKLVNDEELEIDFERLFILGLKENVLVLNPDIPGLAVKYLLVYKR